MIKHELPALAKKLEGILRRDVNRCVKVAGTRPAFYFVEKSYSPALYVVLYQDRPGEVAEMGKKSFEAAFMTYAPAGFPKIRAIFDSMPDFGQWREGLRQMKDCVKYAGKNYVQTKIFAPHADKSKPEKPNLSSLGRVGTCANAMIAKG